MVNTMKCNTEADYMVLVILVIYTVVIFATIAMTLFKRVRNSFSFSVIGPCVTRVIMLLGVLHSWTTFISNDHTNILYGNVNDSSCTLVSILSTYGVLSFWVSLLVSQLLSAMNNLTEKNVIAKSLHNKYGTDGYKTIECIFSCIFCYLPCLIKESKKKEKEEKELDMMDRELNVVIRTGNEDETEVIPSLQINKEQSPSQSNPKEKELLLETELTYIEESYEHKRLSMFTKYSIAWIITGIAIIWLASILFNGTSAQHGNDEGSTICHSSIWVKALLCIWAFISIMVLSIFNMMLKGYAKSKSITEFSGIQTFLWISLVVICFQSIVNIGGIIYSVAGRFISTLLIISVHASYLIFVVIKRVLNDSTFYSHVEDPEVLHNKEIPRFLVFCAKSTKKIADKELKENIEKCIDAYEILKDGIVEPVLINHVVNFINLTKRTHNLPTLKTFDMNKTEKPSLTKSEKEEITSEILGLLRNIFILPYTASKGLITNDSENAFVISGSSDDDEDDKYTHKNSDESGESDSLATIPAETDTMKEIDETIKKKKDYVSATSMDF